MRRLRCLNLVFRFLTALALAVALAALGGCFSNEGYLPEPRPSVDDEDEEPPPQRVSSSPSPGATKSTEPSGEDGNFRRGAPGVPSINRPAAITPSDAKERKQIAEELAAQPLADKPASPLSAEERRARTAENLYRISRAFAAFVEQHRRFPSAIYDSTGKPLLSWRVRLLPYLGYETLLDEFRHDQPWDSPHNLRLLAKIPPPFQSPERFDARTNYLAPVGPHTAFALDAQAQLPRAFDDFEQTILAVEADDAHAVPWTKPEDWEFDPQAPRQGLGTLREDGFFAVLGNGRVHVVPHALEDAAVASFFTVSSESGQPSVSQVTYALSTTGGPALVKNKTATQHEHSGISAIAEEASQAGSGQSLSNSQVASSASVATADSVERLPIPDGAALETARKEVRSLFEARYQNAKDAKERAKLADDILQHAAHLGDEETARYAMLRAALDIAAVSGSLQSAREACDRLIGRYDVDPARLQLDAIKALAASIGQDESPRRELAEWADQAYEDAYARDDFATARECYLAAVGLARSAGDRDLLRKIMSRHNEIETARREYAQAAKAIEALDRNADDPAANRAVGEYFCFVKGEWDRGLSFLVKGDDRRLGDLAALELAFPSEPQTQVELADAWWRLAEGRSSPQKEKVQERAIYWYRQAVANLPESLAKVKAEIRLKEWSR